MVNWIASSLWIFFMLLGVTFIRRNNMKKNFKEIFEEEDPAELDKVILFDKFSTLIIVSFLPVFNFLYLCMYLLIGFCDRKGYYIQKLKKMHQEDLADKRGDNL